MARKAPLAGVSRSVSRGVRRPRCRATPPRRRRRRRPLSLKSLASRRFGRPRRRRLRRQPSARRRLGRRSRCRLSTLRHSTFCRGGAAPTSASPPSRCAFACLPSRCCTREAYSSSACSCSQPQTPRPTISTTRAASPLSTWRSTSPCCLRSRGYCSASAASAPSAPAP